MLLITAFRMNEYLMKLEAENLIRHCVLKRYCMDDSELDRRYDPASSS
jgi:hypothetical protein